MKNEKDNKSEGHNKEAIEKLLQVLSKKSLEARKQKNVHLDQLNALVEEYMSPFILIGYDINGNCVNIMNAKTQKDVDSLRQALVRFVHGGPSQEDTVIGDFMDDDEDNIV